MISTYGLFELKCIRIVGKIEEPLFVAADIAIAIRDDRYVKTIRSYGTDFAYRKKVINSKGQPKNIWVFTELGAYKYLLNNGLPSAKTFLTWTFTQMKVLRKKEIMDSCKIIGNKTHMFSGKIYDDYDLFSRIFVLKSNKCSQFEDAEEERP